MERKLAGKEGGWDEERRASTCTGGLESNEGQGLDGLGDEGYAVRKGGDEGGRSGGRGQ